MNCLSPACRASLFRDLQKLCIRHKITAQRLPDFSRLEASKAVNQVTFKEEEGKTNSMELKWENENIKNFAINLKASVTWNNAIFPTQDGKQTARE